MAKYQIEYNHGEGRKSYSYFTAEDADCVKDLACMHANERLKRDKENASFRSFGYFKPIKTLMVREMDMEKKEPKRGGRKFKLRLTFLQFTTDSGRKERQEWYEYTD